MRKANTLVAREISILSQIYTSTTFTFLKKSDKLFMMENIPLKKF